MPSGIERPALDGHGRQHGDLVARHVNRGHPGAADLVERRTRGNIVPRNRDVDPDPQAPIGERCYRERIVDLGRRRVINREGLDTRIGQGTSIILEWDVR